MAELKKAEPKKARGLGRGLSSLLDEMGPYEVKSAGPLQPTMLPVSMLAPNPHQPRKDFGAEALAELTESVRRHGVLQPLLVTGPDEMIGNYTIIAGERRWRAAQAAGLHEVPVYVRDLDKRASIEAAIIENVQRADLNPMEEAQAYHRLQHEYGLMYAELAEVLGKSRSHVSNIMRLMDLPPSVQAMVQDGRLSLGHAKLLMPADSAQCVELAEKVVAGGLSVRALEGLMKPKPQRKAVKLPRALEKDADLEAVEKAISEALGLRAEIRPRGPTGGDLVLRYSSLDQLDGVLKAVVGSGF